MGKKVLIVGGVAGGASAATRLRRLDENAQIILFEKGEHISFANCGLPYYIGNTISERAKLLVQTAEGMRRRFNIDVRINSEALALDPASRSLRIRSASAGEYSETYDALILAPGAKPLRPSLPGIDSGKIYTLRNVTDADKIKAHAATQGIRSATIVGGGAIGVETAENLRLLGLDVTLVEGAPQVLPLFDPEISGLLMRELMGKGVKIAVSQLVQGFSEQGDQIVTLLGNGGSISSDLVILAIGVAPDTAFLRDSGLELGPRGHIIVNERLETNLEKVYAAGDAIQVVDYVTGAPAAIPLAGPANKQGRIAADNVCGLNSIYKGTLGTSIVKVFDLTGASTGHSEKSLDRLGLPYQVVYVDPNSHASYYPGSTPLTLKLLFNEEGMILGAQAAGKKGVDKRIDVIATVMRLKGNIKDLTELELAYAPPYSSAKDPVNIAGYAAENILTGKSTVFLPRDLEKFNPQAAQLLDVRTPSEYALGHIPGAYHIPLDELRSRYHELDRNKEVWLYCQVGLRGYTASRLVTQLGFSVRNLTGGYKAYLNYQAARMGNQ